MAYTLLAQEMSFAPIHSAAELPGLDTTLPQPMQFLHPA